MFTARDDDPARCSTRAIAPYRPQLVQYQASPSVHVLLTSEGTMSGKADVLALLKLVNQATHDALAAYEAKGQDVPPLASLDAQTLSTMSDDLALKKAIRLLEGACDQLCATLAPPANTVINVSSVTFLRRVISVLT